MILTVVSAKMMEGGCEGMESGRSYVAMFVAGLNGLKRCKLCVPRCLSNERIHLLHLLFESQNETLITKMLGNETISRIIKSGLIYTTSSRSDAYICAGLLHILE